jgi:hypothetical protein
VADERVPNIANLPENYSVLSIEQWVQTFNGGFCDNCGEPLRRGTIANVTLGSVLTYLKEAYKAVFTPLTGGQFMQDLRNLTHKICYKMLCYYRRGSLTYHCPKCIFDSIAILNPVTNVYEHQDYKVLGQTIVQSDLTQFKKNLVIEYKFCSPYLGIVSINFNPEGYETLGEAIFADFKLTGEKVGVDKKLEIRWEVEKITEILKGGSSFISTAMEEIVEPFKKECVEEIIKREHFPVILKNKDVSVLKYQV